MRVWATGASSPLGLRVVGSAGYLLLACWSCGCGEQTPSSQLSGADTSTNTDPNRPGNSSAAARGGAGNDIEANFGGVNAQQDDELALPQPDSSEQAQVSSLDPQSEAEQSSAGLTNGGKPVPVDAGSPATLEGADAVVPLPDDITIWIAGDSTVSNGNTPCPRGWGGEFQPLFDERVRVVNSAAGGRSVRTWLYEVGDNFDESGECELGRDASGQLLLQERWQAALTGMGPGDYLLIQFGINDGDPSCNRHVGLDAFVESYGMMAEAAKQRGAQPVFITPASMIRCNGTVAVGSRGGFVPATVAAGAQFDVPVIDLHALSVELYNQLDFCPVEGGDVSANTTGAVGDFFCDDHTHFDRPGAERIAELMGSALVDSGISLAAYLR